MVTLFLLSAHKAAAQSLVADVVPRHLGEAAARIAARAAQTSQRLSAANEQYVVGGVALWYLLAQPARHRLPALAWLHSSWEG